ncbi:MAG: hypothetical protein Q8P28_02745 [Deltaproteobacteria bacterium]|nr:hypothetical protein [Deltaproteobacteria bacterium]
MYEYYSEGNKYIRTSIEEVEQSIAIAIAFGLVVDDAIVILENIYSKTESSMNVL